MPPEAAACRWSWDMRGMAYCLLGACQGHGPRRSADLQPRCGELAADGDGFVDRGQGVLALPQVGQAAGLVVQRRGEVGQERPPLTRSVILPGLGWRLSEDGITTTQSVAPVASPAHEASSVPPTLPRSCRLGLRVRQPETGDKARASIIHPRSRPQLPACKTKEARKKKEAKGSLPCGQPELGEPAQVPAGEGAGGSS